MTCPICGRLYCDHSPAERGQTEDEMLEDMYAPHIIDADGLTKRVTAEDYEKRTGNKWTGIEYKVNKAKR